MQFCDNFFEVFRRYVLDCNCYGFEIRGRLKPPILEFSDEGCGFCLVSIVRYRMRFRWGRRWWCRRRRRNGRFLCGGYGDGWDGDGSLGSCVIWGGGVRGRCCDDSASGGCFGCTQEDFSKVIPCAGRFFANATEGGVEVAACLFRMPRSVAMECDLSVCRHVLDVAKGDDVAKARQDVAECGLGKIVEAVAYLLSFRRCF